MLETQKVIIRTVAYCQHENFGTYRIVEQPEGSGEPAHMRRLTRAFAARIHSIWIKIKTQNKI